MTAQTPNRETDRDFASFVGSIKQNTAGLKDSLKENFAFDVKGIKESGAQCNSAARETSAICTTTASKARQLVAVGVEMKEALDGFNDGIDLQDFAAVGTVLTSDKMQNALALATEMDDLAIECARQSVTMIDTIDSGIQTLPDILEKRVDKRMENAKAKGSKEGDPEVPNLEDDVRALEDAAKSVRAANPLNAVDSFQKAFDGISMKGELCKVLFGHMKDFADDVAGVSEAIENFKLGKMVGHIRDLVKDIWRCLRLSDLIRSFANAVETLIKWIITVIKAIMEKLKSIDFSKLSCGICDKIEDEMEALGIDSDDIRKFGSSIFKAFSSTKK